jgi:hypothetical protein
MVEEDMFLLYDKYIGRIGSRYQGGRIEEK